MVWCAWTLVATVVVSVAVLQLTMTAQTKAQAQPTPIARTRCRPRLGMSILECKALIKSCREQWNVDMYWTGLPGCPATPKDRKKGLRRRQDAGCQCGNAGKQHFYCGFKCPESCNHPRFYPDTCRWNARGKRCEARNGWEAQMEDMGGVAVCPSS